MEDDERIEPFPNVWCLTVFSNGRSQLLTLATEERSLFTVIISTSPTRNLQIFLAAFQERLGDLAANNRFGEFPDATHIQFSKRKNQRVIGSQSELLRLARLHLIDTGSRPASPAALRATEDEINSAPMSYLRMDSPDRAFRSEQESLVRSE